MFLDNRNEILAVHLVKTYCLPAAVYGGEVWSPTSSASKSLSVAWNNAFRRIFNTCWRESPRSLQFYCDCLPIAYLLDQRRLLFWKKMSISNNTLLRFLNKACQAQLIAIGAKYGIVQPLSSMRSSQIKRHVWYTFTNVIH